MDMLMNLIPTYYEKRLLLIKFAYVQFCYELCQCVQILKINSYSKTVSQFNEHTVL